MQKLSGKKKEKASNGKLGKFGQECFNTNKGQCRSQHDTTAATESTWLLPHQFYIWKHPSDILGTRFEARVSIKIPTSIMCQGRITVLIFRFH